ncbi:hypothetical protein SAMN04488034_102604 [Salinimicrobium catena]|jgi:hypothetical protein|uniref:Uncharacterized protein n=1 Tax=Salinimicrobium catena TaxID=390640 RepID=A0A1H5M801_9FLAO|nr:hypothetical protein [Salinimicrobium catena]SDL19897.1 hypothetical protein SAMN04488140_102604 [Salinimicrobium catena]SEE85496.1 hypothetical protein SAMN04488034_102604 [Salinimicrobium catena]
MAKLYSASPEKVTKMTPKKETIDFLLNYSKALKVETYNKMPFESILN